MHAAAEDAAAAALNPGDAARLITITLLIACTRPRKAASQEQRQRLGWESSHHAGHWNSAHRLTHRHYPLAGFETDAEEAEGSSADMRRSVNA